MTSYLQEQLKSINENKKELEDKYIEIQKKLELELEKNRILEMEGTIDKLKVQVNELSETIGGDIMPNNFKIFYDNMNNDERNKWDTQADIDRCKGLRMRTKLEKLITLEEFKDNLSTIDNQKNKNYYVNTNEQRLVEIKPEIKIYDDILPIFRTMIGIITKQQDEIKTLQNKGNYNIHGVVH